MAAIRSAARRTKTPERAGLDADPDAIALSYWNVCSSRAAPGAGNRKVRAVGGESF